jgi:hypothetical protein
VEAGYRHVRLAGCRPAATCMDLLTRAALDRPRVLERESPVNGMLTGIDQHRRISPMHQRPLGWAPPRRLRAVADLGFAPLSQG